MNDIDSEKWLGDTLDSIGKIHLINQIGELLPEDAKAWDEQFRALSTRSVSD